MPSPSQRDHQLFVVRTWQETSDVAPTEQWRGSVEHVPSGRRLYFSTLDQLSEFVAACANWTVTVDQPEFPVASSPQDAPRSASG